MSQKDPEAGRSIDERVMLRLPTPVVRLMLRGLALLPPGSHVRRRILKRALARGFEAARRDDYAVGLLFYEPDVDLRAGKEVGRTLGLPERYYGHQGFVDIWRDMKQDMDDFHLQPEQIIDLGDRIVLRGTLVGRGRASGLPTRQMTGTIYHLSPRGMVARQDVYWTWEDTVAALNDQGEASRAAGVAE
ncbi:MAG: nuclear transport factor 2 family protein [Solirubrobacteraceae bacterium]